RDGGVLLMSTMFGLFPFLLKLYADSGYQGPKFRQGLQRVCRQINGKRCSTALLPLAGSAVLGWPEAAGFGLSLCSKLMTTLRADIGGLSC
ncbi:MAG TPA: hypothetical protein VHY82_08855, partial [Acetobacteraceae bacterium]|nr:hypothetical protein [Acetobacteraceae bacterium]